MVGFFSYNFMFTLKRDRIEILYLFYSISSGRLREQKLILCIGEKQHMLCLPLRNYYNL